MRTKRDQYQENDGVEEISAFDYYAVNQWVKHFEQSDLDTSEPLAVAILQFCSQFTERLCDNYSDLDPNGDPIDVLFFPYDEDLEVADPSAVVPVLIMAAYFGLLKIVKHLVETSEVRHSSPLLGKRSCQKSCLRFYIGRYQYQRRGHEINTFGMGGLQRTIVLDQRTR
jgi:hypothetical protein